MLRLNAEQQRAVDCEEDVIITACPGSGKTRVLTARVIRGVAELKSPKERVVALTFTNRAADEIQARLDQENVPSDRLWAGTIHSFALEWVLRPYAPYCDVIKRGFSVADEFYTERLLAQLKRDNGLADYAEVSTGCDRNGDSLNIDDDTRRVCDLYKVQLHEAKLIDYDDVLYLAYRLLAEHTEVAETLGSIFRLICVDEVQDVQDLQFGILSLISKAARTPIRLFFVGDENQSIYDSLGAVTKSPEEVASEFASPNLGHLELQGNYRSTQRVIHLYRQFRPDVPFITSYAKYADEDGVITFDDQTVARGNLVDAIASRISASLADGIATKDICVLAPHWWQVRALARQLVNRLPDVEFDAPGLSPLHSSRENVWFKVARLILTSPSPARMRTRVRWAHEALSDLSIAVGSPPPDCIGTARRFLRVLNSFSSQEDDGTAYLRDVFAQLLNRADINIDACSVLKDALEVFFMKAEDRLSSAEGGMPRDVNSFRRLFSHPSGVVVSTCHGVKGEEYETVVAFGLLRGYVPHWSAIINQPEQLGRERESKLLYVICSRAKRRLHLIAESGRVTQRGTPYETARLLRRLSFAFDESGGAAESDDDRLRLGGRG